jgi:hypothetical protein
MEYVLSTIFLMAIIGATALSVLSGMKALGQGLDQIGEKLGSINEKLNRIVAKDGA